MNKIKNKEPDLICEVCGKAHALYIFNETHVCDDCFVGYIEGNDKVHTQIELLNKTV